MPLATATCWPLLPVLLLLERDLENSGICVGVELLFCAQPLLLRLSCACQNLPLLASDDCKDSWLLCVYVCDCFFVDSRMYVHATAALFQTFSGPSDEQSLKFCKEHSEIHPLLSSLLRTLASRCGAYVICSRLSLQSLRGGRAYRILVGYQTFSFPGIPPPCLDRK